MFLRNVNVEAGLQLEWADRSSIRSRSSNQSDGLSLKWKTIEMSGNEMRITPFAFHPLCAGVLVLE